MTKFETSVRIRRPLEEVFAFTSDPLNLPQWNSAVRSVGKTHGRAGELGSTYAMERELPSGRVHNDLEVFAREDARELSIRSTSGPTPFVYRYAFSAENGETVVRLDGEFELDGPARLLGPLAARAVKRGVDDNLVMLKIILET